MGILINIAKYGPIETVGQLIEQVNNLGDVDPDTPISCFCSDTITLEVNEYDGHKMLEIDTP